MRGWRSRRSLVIGGTAVFAFGAFIWRRIMPETAVPFRKRFYTLERFRADVAEVLAHWPQTRAAMRSGRVSKPFAERIMLAVTQINGCRYCQYGHARMALNAGVSQAEIEALAAGDLHQMPLEEQTALLFAQHFAETEGHPDPAAWQRLVDTYGAQTAADILAYIRLIMVGNLYGNTVDALLSRLAGHPAADSSSWAELRVLLWSIFGLPWRVLRGAIGEA